MNLTRHALKLALLGSALALSVGCSLETDDAAGQSEQEARGVPGSLAEAKADALERAASELRDALGEMRHEHQSHEAQASMQREIQELESQARYWRAQARRRR